MKFWSIHWMLAALASASMIVAACGGGRSTPTPAAPMATPPATETPASTDPVPEPTLTPSPTPSPVLPPLRFALADMPGFQMMPSDSAARPYLDVIYDRIIGTDENGNLEAASGWADTWTVNADGTSWTLKSKKRIAFHNGERATSRDIKFGVDRMLADEYLGPGGPGVRKSLDSVRTPDEGTVVLSLKEAGVLFPVTQLSGMGGAGPMHLLPRAYIESRGEAYANKNPVGSGPYRFGRASIGEELALEAVSSHWRFGPPRVGGLAFLLAPDVAIRVSLLKSGKVDVAPVIRLTLDNLRQAEMNIFSRNSGVGAYRLEEQYKDSYEGYGRNPLADARVRRALDWHAIDRQALVNTFMKGFAEPTMSYPATVIDAAYLPLPIPEYDPAKARDLLAEAGFPEGFEMDYYIVPRPAIPEGVDIAEAMASSWEAIGVKVNRIKIDYGSYRYILVGKGFTKPTAFGVWLLTSSPAAGDDAASFHRLSNRFATNLDSELDGLATAWTASSSVKEYVENGQAYMQRYYDLALTTALFSTGPVWAANRRISHWNQGVEPDSYRIDVLAATLVA